MEKRMQHSAEERLREIGLQLPDPIGHGAYISALCPFGENLVYLSGIGSGAYGTGRVPSEVCAQKARQAAADCILMSLATLRHECGSLDRVKRIVKLLVFVASDTDFCDQHLVANGASEMLIDVFGEEIGKSARSAVGVVRLPLNYPVEIEVIAELEEQ